MGIVLKTVGVLVKDMAKTLEFYRVLGLDIPQDAAEDGNVEVSLSNGLGLGFLNEELAKSADPRFVEPVGASLNLQFEASSPSEVDQIFAKLMRAGYQSYAAPWDAFWGQRFARIIDPDGRIVNVYAPL